MATFNETDTSGDGCISLAEQKAAYRLAGVDLEDPKLLAYLQAQYKEVDANGSGAISLAEYMTAAGLADIHADVYKRGSSGCRTPAATA